MVSVINKEVEFTYWVSFCHLPRYSDLEGHHRQAVYDGTLSHPFAITIFEDMIYWTDWNTKAIERGNKFDGSHRTLLANVTHKPYDIIVYHPYKQPIGE